MNQPVETITRPTYGQRWTRLVERVPGPVALLWGITAVLQFVVILRLMSEPITSFGSFLAIMGGLWLLQAIQKGLYAPMHDLAYDRHERVSVAHTLGLTLSRLGAVLRVQVVMVLIFSFIAAVFTFAGAPLFAVFVVLQVVWFLLAPAVYFAVAHRDTLAAALGKTWSAGRKNLLWIVGVPGAFWIFSAGLDPFIWSGDDLLTYLRGASIFLLFGYLRWVAVTAVYAACGRGE